MKVKHHPLLIFVVLFSLVSGPLFAQDDLMDLLNKESKTEEKAVSATFKGTRIILGHSIETKKKGELEFLVSHRFGALTGGAHELWGIDGASVRLGFNYGITNAFTIGLGRGSTDKTYDFYTKLKLLQQKKGASPISITGFTSAAVKTTPLSIDDPSLQSVDRWAYTTQLLIARKFSPSFSMQITPTYLHKNRVNSLFEENDIMALGIGARVKLTKSVTLNAEYFYRFNTLDANPFYNAFSVGFDIETGGHVFQVHLTNSQMTVERAVITETIDSFFKGDIHLGFNISRAFQIANKNKS